MIDLDKYDWALLNALHHNARLSNVDLSEIINLSPSQCSRRLQRLEQNGVIKGFSTQLDIQKLGYEVTALVSVSLERHGKDLVQRFHQEVQSIALIRDCYSVTGDADYLLKVISPNLKALSDFLIDHLSALDNIKNVHSTILLDQIKSSSYFPVP